MSQILDFRSKICDMRPQHVYILLLLLMPLSRGQVHPGELCSATRHSAWSQLCCRSAAWPQLCCRSAAWLQLCCSYAAWRRLRYRGAAAAAASLSHFAAAAQPLCHCRDTARYCRSPPFTAAAPQRPAATPGVRIANSCPTLFQMDATQSVIRP